MRLEERLATCSDALGGDIDQRAHEAIEFLHRAVVGVQGDVDVVVRRDGVRELGERDGAGDHALDGLAGRELRAAWLSAGKFPKRRLIAEKPVLFLAAILSTPTFTA